MRINIKKIVGVMAIVMCMLFCNTTNAYAGLSEPTTKKSLAIDSYEGYGYANNSPLYSNYTFTGVSKMRLTVENNSSKNNLVVKVYQCGFLWDSCVSTVTVPKNGETKWTISTEKAEDYYVRFEAPSNFNWKIEKGK